MVTWANVIVEAYFVDYQFSIFLCDEAPVRGIGFRARMEYDQFASSVFPDDEKENAFFPHRRGIIELDVTISTS